MATLKHPSQPRARLTTVRIRPGLRIDLVRVVLVGLTLATAAIHASLGGVMFTLNAAGYATLAAAMMLPGPFVRIRWLVRLGLLGFTCATIVGWVLFGARFELAYIDKALEVGLIGALLVELWRIDGGPVEIVHRLRWLIGHLGEKVLGRAAR
ncbi:MAG: hypothetical protein ABJC39_09505 [Chloroflexota bacterium]